MIAANTAAPRNPFARAIKTTLAPLSLAALSLGLCAPALAQDAAAASHATQTAQSAPEEPAPIRTASSGPVNLLPYDVGGAENAPVYRLEPVSVERDHAAPAGRETAGATAPGYAAMTPAAVIQTRCISGGFLKRASFGGAAPACAPADNSAATLVSGL